MDKKRRRMTLPRDSQGDRGGRRCVPFIGSTGTLVTIIVAGPLGT